MPIVFSSEIGPLDLETVVEGYLRHSLRFLANPDEMTWCRADPDTAAYDALEKAIRHGPADDAWEGVVKLLRSAPDENFEFFAAGPLEDLVKKRGEELIEQIEAEAERDQRFRWALGCIWLSQGQLPDDVLDRVVRASGGEIEPLPPHDPES